MGRPRRSLRLRRGHAVPAVPRGVRVVRRFGTNHRTGPARHRARRRACPSRAAIVGTGRRGRSSRSTRTRDDTSVAQRGGHRSDRQGGGGAAGPARARRPAVGGSQHDAARESPRPSRRGRAVDDSRHLPVGACRQPRSSVSPTVRSLGASELHRNRGRWARPRRSHRAARAGRRPRAR